ncbi:MAG: PTS sugar transporter subunit IIA [Tissierellia bacterium]|nr:PTS sugar transporter subunit IIA [Tissierellia bacterium]
MEFNEKNTRFDLVVDNWEDAIIESCKPLEKLGLANEIYKYKIINDVKKYGSYIMISPNIVIPHTRPQNGSIDVGYCLTTIKNDIYFDDNKEFPIKVLISFTAIDNENHLEMLKNIIKVIEVGLVNKLGKFYKLDSKGKLNYLNSIIKSSGNKSSKT